MSDIMDFTLIGGWHLEAEADEENEVFHITISNNNGDVVFCPVNDAQCPTKKLSFSVALVKEDKDEEV